MQLDYFMCYSYIALPFGSLFEAQGPVSLQTFSLAPWHPSLPRDQQVVKSSGEMTSYQSSVKLSFQLHARTI